MRHKLPNNESLEQQLAAMALPPVAIDRDRVMYESGWRAAEAAARSRGRGRLTVLWPAVSVLSTAATITLAVLLAREWSQPTMVVDTRAHTSAPGAPVASAPDADAVSPQAIETPPAEAIVARPAPFPATSTPSRLPVWLQPLQGAYSEPLAVSSVVGWRTRFAEQGLDAVWNDVPSSQRGTLSDWDDRKSPPTSRELLDELLGS